MAKAALPTYQFKGKGVTALLGEESREASGVRSLPLAQIALPTKQPRRYFDLQALQDLRVSIQTHGILTPLLVRPVNEDIYELVAGERRFRAAQELGLIEVPVLVRELTDTDASEVALLENLQREDLNPVEETEGILELLERKLQKSREEVIVLLNRAAHPKQPSVQNVLHSPEWKTVEAIFTSVERFTPNSFRASRLPLLKLPEDILVALWQGKIEYTKAQAIARVKDQQERKTLLEETISNNLSLTQIKRQAQQSRYQNRPEDGSLEARWVRASSQLKKIQLWRQLEQREKFEHVLTQIEHLLARHQD